MVKRLCIIIHVCIFVHVKLRLLYSAALQVFYENYCTTYNNKSALNRCSGLERRK